MRILQLGKFYPIEGGVEKVMWDLTDGISRRRIECDMLCAVLSENVDWLTSIGLRQRWVERMMEFNEYGRCICVLARRKVASTMISPAMVMWLRKHCREYDIIHVHHPDPMACVALRLSGYKGKVVLHWHSDILKQEGLLLDLYKPFQKWLINRADIILGTSPVYVKESPWLQDVQDKVSFLPIGIEDNLRKSPVHTAKATKVVFSLGRLVEYKGFEYLIEAAGYLPDNYRVVIGGGGPLREDLEEKIMDANLSGKVKLMGLIPPDELADMYNGCDVFVLSSVMKTEAFGIVQIEAMSCGKPVVSTRIPGSGVSWVNENGVSGLTVPVRDARALADAVVAVCEDKERYNEYCKRARERYETKFSFRTMVDGALEIYDRLLGNENK